MISRHLLKGPTTTRKELVTVTLRADLWMLRGQNPLPCMLHVPMLTSDHISITTQLEQPRSWLA